MIHSEKAYAKVNLFLDVLSKRPDGYHDIGTLFQTIDAHDTLHAEDAADGVELTYNVPQDYPVSSDLVYRAAQALREFAGVKQGVKLHLEKSLPLGAGLGGGSADAAAALRLLNRMWNLGVSAADLCAIGAKLGADVPFLIEGGTALATGIGDVLDPVRAPLFPKNLVVLVVTPHCAVPTKAAYAGIVPSGPARWSKFRMALDSKTSILSPDFDLYNKFEESVLPQYPKIGGVKADLLRLGALRVLMSGSGASVFSLFDAEIDAKKALEAIRGQIRWGAVARFTHFC